MQQPHPFGGLYAAWLYSERCGERERVNAAFPQIKESFESFEVSGMFFDVSFERDKRCVDEIGDFLIRVRLSFQLSTCASSRRG